MHFMKPDKFEDKTHLKTNNEKEKVKIQGYSGLFAASYNPAMLFCWFITKVSNHVSNVTYLLHISTVRLPGDM